MRELIPYLRKREADDPVTQLELQLTGLKIPGFFPTPKPLISRMLEIADIKPGDTVLEPSAGKGDILDLISEKHPDATVTAIEPHATLVEIIGAKGHDCGLLKIRS